MNKNISWDLDGGQSLEEFWGDKRGGGELREDRGAMNKYVVPLDLHDPQIVDVLLNELKNLVQYDWNMLTGLFGRVFVKSSNYRRVTSDILG